MHRSTVTTLLACGSAVLMVGLLLGAIGVSAAFNPGVGTLPLSAVLFALQFVPLAMVGALIAARRPAHRIGWLLGGMGMLFGGGGALAAGARCLYDPAAAVGAALVVASNQLFKLVFCSGAVLLLLFPTGRLASRRWRWLIVGLAVLVVVAMAADVVTPGPVVDYLVAAPPANPFGVELVAPVARAIDRLGFGFFALLTVAAISLVSRYRHASADERLQLKWFALAAGVWATTLVGDGVFRTRAAGPSWPELRFQFAYSFGTAAMAAGIGVPSSATACSTSTW